MQQSNCARSSTISREYPQHDIFQRSWLWILFSHPIFKAAVATIQLQYQRQHTAQLDTVMRELGDMRKFSSQVRHRKSSCVSWWLICHPLSGFVIAHDRVSCMFRRFIWLALTRLHLGHFADSKPRLNVVLVDQSCVRGRTQRRTDYHRWLSRVKSRVNYMC